MDRSKYQYEGMKWIFELELLNHPQAINTIKLNILAVSKRIKEVELLIYRENKSMLVLLELSWMGRKFNRREIFEDVQEVLAQLLPSFRIRVIDDPEIMNMSIEKVKNALSGGKNEKTSNSNINVNQSTNTEIDGNANPEAIAADIIDVPTNNQEPSQDQQELRPEVSSDNSNEKPEA